MLDLLFRRWTSAPNRAFRPVFVVSVCILTASLAVPAHTQLVKPDPSRTYGQATLNKGTLAAIPEDGCDGEAVMKGNQVVLPNGATDSTGPEDVANQDDGTLASLYPNANTATDAFYPLPCDPSIGGTLPQEVNQQPTAAQVAAESYLDAFEQNQGTQIVSAIGGDKVLPPQTPLFKVGPCNIGGQAVNCNSTTFLQDDQPFEGRDIIYVNGFSLNQIEDWAQGDAQVQQQWPGDSAAFLSPTGYFRHYAEDYWRDHIRENLFDPDNPTNPNAGYEWTESEPSPVYRPKSNRYLLIAWSTDQTLNYAQDALLTQIKLAMTTGLNVVTPPTYNKRWVKPFCANGCVIISHSTGGLIVSSAMGRAAKGDFGPGAKLIPGYIRTHVALESATSGSRLATIAYTIGVDLAAQSSAVQGVLCPIEDNLLQTTNSCSLNTGFVTHTVLRDLIPTVAQLAWGDDIAASPVLTVTVAGGHPIGNHAGMTNFFLPGLDDGVVSMNSACGNPSHVTPGLIAASGETVKSPLKAFDMGIAGSRAIKMYLSALNYRAPPPGPLYMSGGCTPNLSTTGMVMPVMYDWSGTIYDTRKRYHNYYSFIQGAIDHSHDGGSDDNNKWPSALGQPAPTPRDYLKSFGVTNDEEMSAITDSGIYQQDFQGVYLVKPSFAGQMHQFTRGRKISFKLFGHRYRWWIWKRTYALLNHYENKSSANFVYEYVDRR